MNLRPEDVSYNEDCDQEKPVVGLSLNSFLLYPTFSLSAQDNKQIEKVDSFPYHKMYELLQCSGSASEDHIEVPIDEKTMACMLISESCYSYICVADCAVAFSKLLSAIQSVGFNL